MAKRHEPRADNGNIASTPQRHPVPSFFTSVNRSPCQPLGHIEASAFPQGYPLLWISRELPQAEAQAPGIIRR